MKNLNVSKFYLIDILFCTFPISLILGNLVTNLNIILFCFYTLIVYKKKIFKINFNHLDKLLFIFFFYTLVVLLVNYFEHQTPEKQFSEEIVKKTIFFFRYLILYISLRFLISKDIINLDLFKFICALCAGLISFDIFIQFFTGKNIFGMPAFTDRHFSSFFGKELIAGGYIQKFSLFIFFLPFFLNKKQNYKQKLTQFFLFLIILISIILSGNRMPIILYVFSIIVFTILNKNTRKKIFYLLGIIIIIIFLSYKNNTAIKYNLSNFYNDGKFLITTLFDPKIESEGVEVWSKPYVNEFQCGKNAIKLNPFFGGGIKSYRVNFSECNSHPHNYYLEIASDLGIIGLFLIVIFISKLFFIILKNYETKKFSTNFYFEKTIPIFLILLLEFFPFRTTGSFFTTNNATVIFIMIALLVSYCDKNSKKI